MRWNWERADWPNFSWRRNLLTEAEERFLIEAGTLRGMTKHLAAADQQQIAVEALSNEAVTTSEIEGEFLDRTSVQSSIRRQLGLATEDRRANAAEKGVAELMVDLLRSFLEPLSHATLYRWHKMLVGGRKDLKHIGEYRKNAEPMQVVSGAIYAPRVHFEAPPSSEMDAEMEGFVSWFNRTAPTGAEPLPALTRAGMAHLYFVSIHPFEDGNGRVGRAIAEKALGQNLGEPSLIALAATILRKQKGYYAALETTNKRNEISPWLTWFAATTIEAQRRAIAEVEFIISKTRLLDSLRGQINERQEKALLRMLREGTDGFKGGLSAAKYQSITGASPATATRDLADLVQKSALVRDGLHKHARYHLNLPLIPVRPLSIDEEGGLVSGAKN